MCDKYWWRAVMIKFEEIFKLDSLGKKNKIKFKFNMNNDNRDTKALDQLLDDTELWIPLNAHRKGNHQANNNLDNYDYLVSFAQYYPYGNDYYMFGGIYKIVERYLNVNDGVGYKLELCTEFNKYRKRVIIKLEKPVGQTYGRTYKSVIEDLKPTIFEIRPENSINKFLGYNKVCLTHNELQRIFNGNDNEWKNALSVVKAVYCITDTSTGKLYIGSAYSENECLWHRWKCYADENNLTGGNVVFEDFKNIDKEYIKKNFTYTILEIMDPKTSKDIIIDREQYWKKVFKTIEFGMNRN